MALIEVFSSPGCGYCDSAKALLAGKGLAFQDIDITRDAAQFEALRRRLPRTKAVPQIFIDGRHIGGFEDLQLLDQRGELAALTGA